MASKRTIITLSEEDKAWLDRYSRLHRVSIAQVIRSGIHELKDREYERTYTALLQSTKGVWKRGDGLSYQRKVRSEWK